MLVMRLRLLIAAWLVQLARWVAPRREVCARLLDVDDNGIAVREVER